MTRIVAGMAGSLRLDVPGKGTRPTSDKVREAIFSSLESWGFTENVRVLDLYAGSGALGLEALSRGASHATFVEHHSPAARTIVHNLRRVLAAFAENQPQGAVQTAKVKTFLEQHPRVTDSPYDVVFLDPPYDLPSSEVSTNLALVEPLCTDDAVLIVERDSRSEVPSWPENLRLVRTKVYGETTVYSLEIDRA